MAANSIANDLALLDGASLWVIPNRQYSLWARRIDWYLNFQQSSTSQHKTPELSAFLKQTLSENEIHSMELALPQSAPLLVASNGLLPCKHVLRITYTGELEPWFEALTKAWRGLSKPTLRVFLPKGVSSRDFHSLWKKNPGADCAVVEDLQDVHASLAAKKNEDAP